MGIDVNTFNFLNFCHRNHRFGKVITLGRQGLHVPSFKLRTLCKKYTENNKYADDLIKIEFGASDVHSIDCSDFEGANLIHDLNTPIDDKYHSAYQTVIDGGCLEHIYDFPVAMRNVASLLEVGGRVIHILPMNNAVGHGFWQISPELFYSIYSKDNDFDGLEMYIAYRNYERIWYKLLKPSPGHRLNIKSFGEMYLMVTARKIGNVDKPLVQQSDYVEEWNNPSIRFNDTELDQSRNLLSTIKSKLKRIALLEWSWFVLKDTYSSYFGRESATSNNPYLKKIEVSELCG